ncbi:MAG: glycoside hydrolase family 16 protein [Planctomycetia bacterium]|nr:glycoside hydrolase family 16 protein [Planctomycetia bacterium]
MTRTPAPLILLALSIPAARVPPACAAEPPPAPAGWEPVWADEFDRDGPPNPAKWDYEEGFVRNKEAQFYTRARAENARVEGGMLVIEARKERFRNPRFDAAAKDWRGREWAAYTSASLITLGRASWTECRIDVRARLPKGAGTWPAIWTLGIDRGTVAWPRCGEIDILESFGKNPTRAEANVWFAGKQRPCAGAVTLDRPLAEDFHLFGMERSADRIDFFLDSRKYHSFAVNDAGEGADNPFRRPHYLLVNLALGGTGGGPIDDAALPQQLAVDYVRVFRRAGAD